LALCLRKRTHALMEAMVGRSHWKIPRYLITLRCCRRITNKYKMKQWTRTKKQTNKSPFNPSPLLNLWFAGSGWLAGWLAGWLGLAGTAPMRTQRTPNRARSCSQWRCRAHRRNHDFAPPFPDEKATFPNKSRWRGLFRRCCICPAPRDGQRHPKMCCVARFGAPMPGPRPAAAPPKVRRRVTGQDPWRNPCMEARPPTKAIDAKS
jgi:hypothetical protein